MSNKICSKKQEIEKSLGKPKFESGNLIGYKSENIYVFFYKNQILFQSIANLQTYSTAIKIAGKKEILHSNPQSQE